MRHGRPLSSRTLRKSIPFGSLLAIVTFFATPILGSAEETVSAFKVDLGFQFTFAPPGTQPHLSLENYLTLVNSRTPPITADGRPAYDAEYAQAFQLISAWESSRRANTEPLEILGAGLGLSEVLEPVGKIVDKVKAGVDHYYEEGLKSAVTPVFDAIRSQSYYQAIADAVKAAPEDRAWATAEDQLARLNAFDKEDGLLKAASHEPDGPVLTQQLNRLFLDYIRSEHAVVSDLRHDVSDLKAGLTKARGDIKSVSDGVRALEKKSEELQKRVQDLEQASRDEKSPAAAAKYRREFEDFAESAHAVASQLSSAANIGRHLNVDENVVADLDLSAHAVDLTAQASACFASYVSCLPAISSGFDFVSSIFGHKRDPMAALVHQLLQRLAQIERKLDEYHAQEMAELYKLQWNQLAIYEEISYFESQPIATCAGLVNPAAFRIPSDPNHAELDWSILPGTETRFASFEEFHKHAADHASSISECEQAMQTAFLQSIRDLENINPLFLETPLDVSATAQDTDLQHKRQAVANYDKKFGATVAGLVTPKALLLAMSLSPTCSAIDDKIQHSGIDLPTQPLGELAKVASAVPAATPQYREAFIQKYYTTPLNAPFTRRAASLLVGMNYYWQFAPGGELLDQAVIVKNGSHEVKDSGTALETLSGAVPLIDLAVAQQSLYGGDVLLPIAYEVWRDWEDPREWSDRHLICDSWVGHDLLKFAKPDLCARTSELKATAAFLRKTFFDDKDGLVTTNVLFAENLARYIVYRRLAERHHGPLSYDVLWSASASETLLGSLIGNDLGLVYGQVATPDGGTTGAWFMTLGNRTIPLPTPSAVASQAVAVQEIAAGLADVRHRLLGEIVGYIGEDTQAAAANSQ